MKAKFAVEMRSICKSFGTTRSNHEVDLSVLSRSIHAIVGENGAGKSTVMKILYGMYAADSGSVSIRGERVDIASSADAIRLGVGMVHQHFMLIPSLTVTENISLGYEQTSFPGRLNIDDASERIRRLAERYELPIDPEEKVENLPVGLQQRTEILKALYRNAEILILDEPTAVITPLEVKAFFKTLRGLKENGKTIIVITHKLEEVMELADRVTVMRAGLKVGDLGIEEASVGKIANMMIGKEIVDAIPSRDAPSAKEVFSVKGLRVSVNKTDRVKGVDFSVTAGEIVGIAGVSGNGQTELEMALAGLLPVSSGEFRFKGETLAKLSPAKNRRMNIAHVPSDRERLGYVKGFSNADNLILGYQRDGRFCSPFGWRKRDSIRRNASEAAKKYNVVPDDPSAKTDTLSGGNKQKLVIAREFERKPEFMILAEPTRGVDIGAVAFIHEKILELRKGGAAVLLISAELKEIRKLADRAYVMFEGQFVGSFNSQDYEETKVGLMLVGKRREPERASPNS